MVEESDLVHIRGETALRGSGSSSFVNDQGNPLLDESGADSFVYETGVPINTRSALLLKPPIDIAITADNWCQVYVNSTTNRVINKTGEDTDTEDGENCELGWQNPVTTTDISMPEDAENVIGIRWWNGPDDGTVDTTVDSSQQGFVMTFRDANGKKVAFTKDTFTLTIDTHFDETEDGNPYGTDWVDPTFDDSAWELLSPSDLNISDNSWSTGFDDCLSTTDFFDTDPQWANQHPETVDDGSDLQGYGFARVVVQTT